MGYVYKPRYTRTCCVCGKELTKMTRRVTLPCDECIELGRVDLEEEDEL